MIHMRVVSPSDVTDQVVPRLRSEPAVLNLTVLRSGVRNPDGDAVHGSTLQLLLNITVLALVAIVGLPIQRAMWRAAMRRSTTGATTA